MNSPTEQAHLAPSLKPKDSTLFRQQTWIDGAWRDADGGRTIPVDNPSTGQALGTVAKMEQAEIRCARTEAEAIEMANDTAFGLASYFYGRDLRMGGL